MTKNTLCLTLTVLFASGISWHASTSASAAKTYSLGADSASNFVAPQVTYSPEPEIPSALHENCFKSCCIAKFMVAEDGKTSVQLLSSSGSEEIDEITLRTLRNWRFKPATLDGKPVPASKKVQVEFQVD